MNIYHGNSYVMGHMLETCMLLQKLVSDCVLLSPCSCAAVVCLEPCPVCPGTVGATRVCCVLGCSACGHAPCCCPGPRHLSLVVRVAFWGPYKSVTWGQVLAATIPAGR